MHIQFNVSWASVSLDASSWGTAFGSVGPRAKRIANVSDGSRIDNPSLTFRTSKKDHVFFLALAIESVP